MKTSPLSSMEIRHLSKSYRHGKKQILNDLSVTAQDGDCIGILGVNGCGKSTLLSILAGVLKPDQGELLYHGSPYTDSRQISSLCGYVPQENPLMEELDAYDNLQLWYCHSKLDLQQELKNGLLAALQIPEFLHVRVSQMSGGMKKRLSIGCAMAEDPPILLLDEPGAALDLPCKEQIISYLLQCRKAGKIIWIATHELQEMEICSSLYVLQDGKLTPTEYHHEIHEMTAALQLQASDN